MVISYLSNDKIKRQEHWILSLVCFNLRVHLFPSFSLCKTLFHIQYRKAPHKNAIYDKALYS